MAAKSVQRTMDLLTKAGLSAFVVEKFNPFAGRYGQREDFMGFIDIIAMSRRRGIVGVQACGSDWSSHVRKIMTERRKALDTWTSAGGKVWLVGWRKLKVRNKDGKLGKREAWVPRIAEWNGTDLVERDKSPGFICAACAESRGAIWPVGHVATMHTALCSECGLPAGVASIGDWDWPKGSKCPGSGNGRD